ncbi:hypothetical protein HK097_010514, partial [Rhizophlyctis rosea]
FPYLDTLKIQQKFSSSPTSPPPTCHFYPHGNTHDISSLRTLLTTTHISALFTEFPSNPLLHSPDLASLRKLADEYGFLIVVDETIGNFVNVDVLGRGGADVVVSSLTKVFSGESNVMGGSAVLNPQSRHYEALKKAFEERYEDNVFEEDAVFLERNSRNFRTRIHQINRTAEKLADYLHSHPKVETVYYPKYTDREVYEKYAHRNENGKVGYGTLLTIVLKPEYDVKKFYDALVCQKGPSLGTNFTLASPYAILAHYGELEWAEECGVSRWLIRVSVGLENSEGVRGVFERALEEA